MQSHHQLAGIHAGQPVEMRPAMSDTRFIINRVELRSGEIVFELKEWNAAKWWGGKWVSRGTYPTKDDAEKQMRDIAERPHTTNAYFYDRFGHEDLAW